MDFNTAVKNAMEGDSESFAFLYSSTYSEMYYLAVKYIKNEQDAENIVQDSYAKAKNNMGMLHDFEKFRSWLGCIVANTTLTYLKRKKPLIFSSIGGEDNNGESFIYEPTDDNEAYRPEKAYSNQELKNLIRELIDSLSDEQRICIIMYHMNGQSIRAIADSMGCSENTVKSRLYYGRNTLRKKMEILRKNGYQINCTAPIPFLKYLLKTEFAIPETQISASRASNNANELILPQIKTQMPEEVNYSSLVTYTAIGSSNIKDFFGTITGNLTIVLVASVILSGTITAVTLASDDNLSEFFGTSIISEDDDESSNNKSHYRDTDDNSQNSSSSAAQLVAGEKVISDEDFPKIVRGELTKDQLAFVLARLPGDYDIENDENKTDDYIKIFCADIEEKGSEVGFTPSTGAYPNKDFQTDEINRILSSFKKDDKITLDNHPGDLINDGSTMLLDVTPNKDKVKAVFKYQKNKNNKSLEIVYELHQHDGTKGTVTKRRATLLPIADEKFVITKIVTEENIDTDNMMNPLNKTVLEPNTDSEAVSQKVKDTDKNTDTDKTTTSSVTESSMATSKQEDESFVSHSPDSEKTNESTVSNYSISRIEKDTLSIDIPQESQPYQPPESLEEKKDKAKENFLNIIGDHYFFDIDNDGVEEGIIIDGGKCSFYVYNDDSAAYELSASTNDLNRPELQTNGIELIIIRKNDDPVYMFRVVKNGFEISFEPISDIDIEGYEPLEQS